MNKEREDIITLGIDFNEAWHEGYNACRNGIDSEDNPHNDHPHLRRMRGWLRGWLKSYGDYYTSPNRGRLGRQRL